MKAISEKEGTKDSINKFSILNRAKYFSSEIFQNYLVFILAKKYIKYFSDTTRIKSWKSNGVAEENIENIINLAAILHLLLLINIYYQTRLLMDTV